MRWWRASRKCWTLSVRTPRADDFCCESSGHECGRYKSIVPDRRDLAPQRCLFGCGNHCAYPADRAAAVPRGRVSSFPQAAGMETTKDGGGLISMADQTLAVMERFNAALERHDIEGMLA